MLTSPTFTRQPGENGKNIKIGAVYPSLFMLLFNKQTAAEGGGWVGGQLIRRHTHGREMLPGEKFQKQNLKFYKNKTL